MTALPPPVLDRLDRAAKAAQAAEIAYRATVVQEIARHERLRQFAFRRLWIARALATSLAEESEADAAAAAGEAVLMRELDWQAPTEARGRILAAFRPVTLAVWAAVRPPEGEPEAAAEAVPQSEDSAAVEQAFAAFEAWYEDELGTPFLALLDQEVPETPLVEF